MKIAIYGSRRQEAHLQILDKFMRAMAEEGHEIVMHPKVYRYLLSLIPSALKSVRRVTDDASDSAADVALSIGGDGTFLRTAEWVGASGTPIAGINTGHLGYLTACGIEGIEGIVSSFREGRLGRETRRLIEIVSPQLSIRPFALNEIALLKSENAAMINVKATVDGAHLADYRVDGLLVSTPTGSTAYNLSVGGPIVQPSAPVWVVSPIAAHSLSMRPIVINDSANIMLTASGRAPHVRLSVDGRSVIIDTDTQLHLRRAPFVVNVLHADGYGFASTLREKLHWGEE